VSLLFRTCLRLVSLAVALFVLLAQTGCLVFDYLPQAAAGQRDLSRRARDIDQLLAEGRVAGRMRRLLSQVSVIRAYGEAHGLAATPNYTKYVRVDTPPLVWVVSGSEPLRFQSRIWSFPLVGSFTYLGWFKRPDADVFAARLAKDGLDVDVRSSGAYSTAGFFEDPIVSTMIAPGDLGLGELADTLQHEMTHSTIFVKYQSTLNESVAMFTGRGLAADYLRDALGADAPETKAYTTFERQSDERGRKMKTAYETLKALYASTEPDAAKLVDKREILRRLHDEIHFKRPINNATLIQYRTYHSGLDELGELLAVCDHDWRRFLMAVKSLEKARFERPQESDVGKLVAPLVAARCAPLSSPR
jgi:predicted aminopeptidase